MTLIFFYLSTILNEGLLLVTESSLHCGISTFLNTSSTSQTPDESVGIMRGRTTFTFIKPPKNDTRLLQYNHTDLYAHPTAR